MIAAEKPVWKLLLLIIFAIATLASGQTPDSIADSLRQLRDVTMKRALPGTNDYVRYCAFCHGNEGKGDGLNAFNLTIRPRDFTDTTAMRGKTPGSIERVIRTGGAANRLSADMPPWGTTLDSVCIEHLTGYIISRGRPANVSGAIK